MEIGNNYNKPGVSHNGACPGTAGSSKTRFAANIRTNTPAQGCPEDLLRAFADFLAKLLRTDVKDLILELQTNVTMIRGGSMDPAMNIEIHHNSDGINRESKVGLAEQIAKFFNTQLKIPRDRTLVLFFDTRKCT